MRALLLALALLVCSPGNAQEISHLEELQLASYRVELEGLDVSRVKWWQWSKPQPYHRAVVQIRVGSSGGSATHIGGGYFISAAHCFSGGASSVQVTWPDGTTSNGRLLGTDRAADVAIFQASPHQGKPSIPVADRPSLEPGAYLECVGFGGPAKRQRHFWATLITKGYKYYHSRGLLLNGDSGGAVLYGGKLVGVISGGQRLISIGLGSWRGHFPARSSDHASIALLVQRHCPGGHCPPTPRYSPAPGGGTGPEYYPPPPAPEPIPAPEIAPLQGAKPELAPPEAEPRGDLIRVGKVKGDGKAKIRRKDGQYILDLSFPTSKPQYVLIATGDYLSRIDAIFGLRDLGVRVISPGPLVDVDPDPPMLIIYRGGAPAARITDALEIEQTLATLLRQVGPAKKAPGG